MKHITLAIILLISETSSICKAVEQKEPMLITSDTIITEDLEFDHTAFVIQGSNITLDLNGHTVKFNTGNATDILNPSFELWNNDSPSEWEVVSGSVTRAPSIYFGTYDLVMASGGGILRSSTISLPANRTFLPFAYVKSNKNNISTIKVIDANDKSILAKSTLTSNILKRGYASHGNKLGEKFFKSTTEKDIYLELELSGTAGAFTVGMVNVKKAWDYGVVANNYKHNIFHCDIPDGYLKGASNITIKNGTLEQVNEGVRATGIKSYGKGWIIDDVDIILRGISTDGIVLGGGGGIIKNSSIKSTSKSVFNRMHGNSGIKLSPAPSNTVGYHITNNSIDGVPQFGLLMYGCIGDGVPEKSYITNNTIKQKESVTEGYAIALSGIQNFDISSNTITPYYGRGILIDATSGCSNGGKGTRNISISNNNITNINEFRNAEYGENSLETVGIRIRNWGGADKRAHYKLRIFDNTISGFTDSNRVHAVYGINVTVSSDIDDIEIYENTISTIGEGKDRRASAIALQNVILNGENSLLIHGNSLKSNLEILRLGGNDGKSAVGFSFYDNTIGTPTGFKPAEFPFRAGFWNGSVGQAFISNNTFSSNELNPTQVNNWRGDLGSTGLKQLFMNGHMLHISVLDNRTDKATPLSLSLVIYDPFKNKITDNTLNKDYILTMFLPISIFESTNTMYTSSAYSMPSQFNLTASTPNHDEVNFTLTNEKNLTITVNNSTIDINSGAENTSNPVHTKK